jgi:hypothetical protein
MVAEWISERSLWAINQLFALITIVVAFCMGAMFQQFVHWVNEDDKEKNSEG